MKSLTFLFLAQLFGNSLSQTKNQDLLLVVQLSRHGYRQPSDLFNLTAPGVENFPNVSLLTERGKHQTFQNGQLLRQRYVNELQFLPNKYDQSLFYLQSSNKSRTYLSALYQMMGMYEEAIPNAWDVENNEVGSSEEQNQYLSNQQKQQVQKKDDNNLNLIKINQRSAHEDLTLQLDEKNCNRYKKLAEATSGSQGQTNITNYFIDNLKSLAETITGFTNLSDIEVMDNVCGYVYWANYDHKNLSFEQTQEFLNLCQALGDSGQYSKLYGLNELWKLTSYDFMNKMLLFSRFATKHHNYLKFNRLVSENERLSYPTYDKSIPRFINFAAHSENLTPVLEALRIRSVTRLPPGTSLLFEFYNNQTNNNNSIWVRLGLLRTAEGSVNQNKIEVLLDLSLDQFIEKIKSNLGPYSPSLKEYCKTDPQDYEMTNLYDAELALRELSQIYNLPNLN
eukprot:403363240